MPDILAVMTAPEPYAMGYQDMPHELQAKARELCWRYNQLSPAAAAERAALLEELLGEGEGRVVAQPPFNCDYGFNIHAHGYVFFNYGCSVLDTSPVDLGDAVFVGPGTCLACAGHAIVPEQRAEGIGTSAPIAIESNVWIGANVTVCGGVTIGTGSVIGAGSVVTRSIPAGVVAAGAPCRAIRPITDADRVRLERTGVRGQGVTLNEGI